MEVHSKNKITSKLNKFDIYKTQMEEISFMTEHQNDVPEIFDVNSEKCKLFLVKTFTILNTKFHYLSFIGNESIGQELAKAASILRIYPYNVNQKSNEIFHNMSDAEIHRFWMRFFKLCKINSSHIDSSMVNKSTDNIGKFHSIFSDVKKTIQYINYDMSVINPKKLKGIDVNSEVESWIPCSFLTSISESSVNYMNPEMTFQEKHEVNVDIENLICDLDYIKKKADFEMLSISKPSYPYKEFFNSFNHAVKIIKVYRDYITFISSFNVEDLLKNTKLHKKSYWISNNCQIERCNNIIQNIILAKERIC